MPVPSGTCSGHILLVDDNRLGLVARKTVLEELGYRIETATEGSEALAQLREHKFDLIITDYKMPRMNGVELIAKIRQLVPGIQIVLLSGYTDALGLNEENTGANAVIAKSANEVQHLTRTLGRLLKQPASRKTASSQSKLKVRSQTA